MKKLFLTLGLAAFLMTSCCDKQENKENCEQKECCKDKKEQCEKHHECEHQCMDKMVEALANWENLDENQRAEVIDMAKKMQEMKANMPKPECKHHEGCKHEEGHKCEGNHEGCQHQHEGCQHQHEGCQHEDR